MTNSWRNKIQNNGAKIRLILLVFVLLFNSISVVNNLASKQDSMQDNFPIDSINNLHYTNDEPSENFEVYNYSVFDIAYNIITEYTFDHSFDKIVSENSISVSLPYTTYGGLGPVKFTTNGNQSLILQHVLATPFKNENALQPIILELGKLHSANFSTIQYILNISCTIPVYYQTVMHADTCYSKDIELLNLSTLLVIQEYYNQHNFDEGNIPNSYGASLIFYDIIRNETLKSIPLQNANYIDYSYIYAPKQGNDILIYFVNKQTNDQGYLSLNLNNFIIQNAFGANLSPLSRYGTSYYSPPYSEPAVNHPLLINSKFLVFYHNWTFLSPYLENYIWYSIQPQTLGLMVNAIIYIGVFIGVLVMTQKKWLPSLKETFQSLNDLKKLYLKEKNE